ncbi:phage tail tape measure protein [Acinetobacter sp. SwsAc3]|nr:phage tail tape measure protein [Acinetobacter sp. SwsAc3]
MATASLGRLTLDLVAQIGQFVEPMNKAERKAKESTDKMGKAFSNFKDQMNQALGGSQIGSAIDGITGKLDVLKGGVLTASAALAGMAVGGSVVALGGLAAMSIEIAKSNMELAQFAAISNTSVQSFQGLAGAAQTFGFSQEKVSDMMKDFNEKIGEFASVGAGGATDFFEQIAVKTEGGAAGAKKLAEEMSKMDGIEALQTYVNKLEEAGVNQQQMSFYLESMGSDLTALAPLLSNGGQLWKDYQAAMEEAGIITGQDAIEKSMELAAQTESVQMQFTALKNQLAQAVMPALSGVIGYFLEGSGKGGQFAGIIDAVGIAAKGAALFIVGLSAGIKSIVQIIGGAMKAIGNIGQTATDFWDAGTFKGKGEALVNGFNRNGKIIVDTAKDVVANTKQAYTSMSGIISGEQAKFDNLSKSIMNNRKAQLEWTKAQSKGVTSGIAQNKELNPTTKSPTSKKSSNTAASDAAKAARLQEQIERAQQSVIMQYANDEMKLTLRYEEDKKKIAEAFAKDPTNLKLYLTKAKEAYDLDVKAYQAAQKEKYDSTKNDLLDQMANAQDAIALSDVASKFGKNSYQYQVADLNVSSKQAKSGEFDDFTDNVNRINRDYDAPEEAQKRYELLELAKAAHLERMKALDINHNEASKELINQQVSMQLQSFSGLTGSLMGLVDKSSTSYAALYAVQKSFSLAQAMMNGYTAISAAWASAPFPYNMGAVTAATVQSGVLQAAIEAVTPRGYATGGHITGKGTGTSDDIPIWASNGEYMMKAEAVDKLGLGNLDYMNATGNIPGKFADGGLIRNTPDLGNPNLGSTPQFLGREQQSSSNGMQGLTIINQIEQDDLVGGYLRKPAAGQLILNLIKASPSEFKRALGVS